MSSKVIQIPIKIGKRDVPIKGRWKVEYIQGDYNTITYTYDAPSVDDVYMIATRSCEFLGYKSIDLVGVFWNGEYYTFDEAKENNLDVILYCLYI